MEPADTRDCMPSDNAHSVWYPHTQLGLFVQETVVAMFFQIYSKTKPAHWLNN